MNELIRIRCMRRQRKGGAGFVVTCHGVDDGFLLRSQTSEENSDLSLQKFGRIDLSKPHSEKFLAANQIIHLFDELTSVSLSPLPSPNGGFGGTDFTLIIQHVDNKSRFDWWLDCPPEWEPIGRLWQTLVDMAEQA